MYKIKTLVAALFIMLCGGLFQQTIAAPGSKNEVLASDAAYQKMILHYINE